ncbi:MAG: hypothetical protein ACKOQ1_07210, partial [Actinomycetota bacterium]
RVASLAGEVLVEAAALWVHVDRDSLAPSRVPGDVAAVLDDSAAGRKVGARLILKAGEVPDDASRAAWPLRFSDFDAVGHMNNAAYWEVLEEQLVADRSVRAPMRAVVEHIAQVEPGEVLERRIANEEGGSSVLLTVGDVVRAAMWCGTA